MSLMQTLDVIAVEAEVLADQVVAFGLAVIRADETSIEDSM
jgi:hypothetical protein